MSELAAVILSGGTARRLGGVDKSTVEYAGARLLDRSLAAVVDAEPVVVVGPPVPTERPLVFTREDPPLGGPVAGLLAGAAAVREAAGGDPPEWTAVLAVDMPHVTSGTVARLRAAARDGVDGVVLVGPDGRRHLAAVIRSARLAGHPPGHGRSLRDFLSELGVVDVPAVGQEGRDIDRPEDLEH